MSQDQTVARFTSRQGDSPPTLNLTNERYRNVWSAHCEALSIGRNCESHHAELVEILMRGPPAAPGSVAQHEEAVLSYRKELRWARSVLDTLDSQLAELLSSFARTSD